MLQVRAFQPWPGTEQSFCLTDAQGNEELVRLQVTQTQVASLEQWHADHDLAVVPTKTGGLLVHCNDSVLEMLHVKPQGKRVMNAGAWFNGLQGRLIKRTAV